MKRYCNLYAVIGLGFGDEGKGLTVNSLCSQLPTADTLVVRYSGGQQAGHTVTLEDGTSHVFSNFGSGTLQGVPTYWSRYCTFDPVGVVNEHDALLKKMGPGRNTKLLVDKNSPVTTPYDKHFNRQMDNVKEHGTCGAGVGATFGREERFFSLVAGDLLNPSVLKMKLDMIAKHCYPFVDVKEEEIKTFLQACSMVREIARIGVAYMPKSINIQNVIFESSQGLLLDQHTGFFPHVTRSNLGSKNILEIVKDNFFVETSKLFLVTRAYQTRHGNGPMTNEHLPHNIAENPRETNVTNRYQGKFRRTLLDLDLLRYGIYRDQHITEHPSKELVITCLDHVKNEYRYTVNGNIVGHTNENNFVKGIADYLGISKVHRISSPDGIVKI